MSIQEAIKSGKPFRLPGWFHSGKRYYAIVKEKTLPLSLDYKKNSRITLHVFEILSTDWMVKP